MDTRGVVFQRWVDAQSGRMRGEPFIREKEPLKDLFITRINALSYIYGPDTNQGERHTLC